MLFSESILPVNKERAEGLRECTKTYMTENTRKRDTVLRRLYEV